MLQERIGASDFAAGLQEALALRISPPRDDRPDFRRASDCDRALALELPLQGEMLVDQWRDEILARDELPPQFAGGDETRRGDSKEALRGRAVRVLQVAEVES